MMSNNKILTVSYGTFSCTLEGFDDSFDTMKAIAEYFRDLAADDRYFGAEPPQPDAEMLARIAEREIARRVEARLSESGVHLRAGDTTAALTASVPAEPVHEAEGPAEVAAESAPQTQTHQAHDVAAASVDEAPPAAAAEPAQHGLGGPGQAEMPSPDVAEATVAHSMDAVSEAVAASTAPEDQQALPDVHADDTAADQAGSTNDLDEAAASFFAEAEKDSESVFPTAEDVVLPATKPAPNSIADKLQRIRAVVSKTHAPRVDYCEDEHAEPILDDAETDAAHQLSEFFSHPTESNDVADPEAVEMADAAAEVPVLEETSEIDTAEVLAGVATEFATEASNEEAGIADDGQEKDGDDDDGHEDDGAYDFSSLFLDQEEASTDDVQGEAVQDHDAVAAERAPVEEADLDEPAADKVRPAETTAVRARVIMVKRSELTAALESDRQEAAEANDGHDRSAARTDREAEETTAQRLRDVAAQEDELDRLMAEADTQMEEPDATSRRAAFDQMRGAVAATDADEALGEDGDSDDEAYRTDFAEVVKPRRPVSSGRTERPRDQRPAPLKLVAEQRVDVPSAATGPVQPRRVAASQSTRPVDDECSFAEYAAARGAQELSDLLEAAASYLSFVEGRDQFSRPQLMSKVRQVDPDRFSREDGLRHFGMLLRSGKIEKIEGGRFTVSDDIGFRPDGERAAG